jgi:hypothetical protein
MTRKRILWIGVVAMLGVTLLFLSLLGLSIRGGDDIPLVGRPYVKWRLNQIKEEYGSKVDAWIMGANIERYIIDPPAHKDQYTVREQDHVVIRPFQSEDSGEEYWVVFFITYDLGRQGENGYFYTQTGKLPTRGPLSARIYHMTDLGGNWYYFKAT